MKRGKRAFEGEVINGIILLKYLGKRYWEVQCHCGKILKIRRDHIYRRKSCGCLSKFNHFNLKSSKEVITNVKLNHYKQSAKDRGFEWKLTDDEFYNLIIDNCYYCGGEPSQLVKTINHSCLVNGVDRVDSNIGYIQSNVVSCCKFCNFAKSDSTLEEFKNWINRLIKFNKDENFITK